MRVVLLDTQSPSFVGGSSTGRRGRGSAVVPTVVPIEGTDRNDETKFQRATPILVVEKRQATLAEFGVPSYVVYH